MLIRVSAGNCSVAVALAISQVEGVLQTDAKAANDKCFQQLHDGAVHNGLNPSSEQLEQMRNMAASDVEHMMQGHPGKEQLFHLNRMKAMLNYTKDSSVVIDDSDFGLLQEHLPEADSEEDIA